MSSSFRLRSLPTICDPVPLALARSSPALSPSPPTAPSTPLFALSSSCASRSYSSSPPPSAFPPRGSFPSPSSPPPPAPSHASLSLACKISTLLAPTIIGYRCISSREYSTCSVIPFLHPHLLSTIVLCSPCHNHHIILPAGLTP